MSRAQNVAQEALDLVTAAQAGEIAGVYVDGDLKDRAEGVRLHVLDENGAFTATSLRVVIDPETGKQGTTLVRRLGEQVITARMTTSPIRHRTSINLGAMVMGDPDTRDRARWRRQDARLHNAGETYMEVDGEPRANFRAPFAVRAFVRSLPRKPADAKGQQDS